MINAQTNYRYEDLLKAGISHGEFLALRMAGLTGMHRGKGTAAWYVGEDVMKYQKIVSTQRTKAPGVKARPSRFVKRASV